MRIAAVGDLHCRADTRTALAAALAGVDGAAECLLLAGDLTDHGTAEEASWLAEELDRESAQTLLVASLDPASQIRRGEPAHLWFDPAHLYLFDAGTGESLTSPKLDEHVPEHQDTAGH